MDNKDPRIDEYIMKSADFAMPILMHLRLLVHEAFPQIKETIKWGMPFFDYKGTVCMMASFKHHCAFGFWKPTLLSDPNKLLQVTAGEAMGQFGQIKSLNDLPEDDILIAYIREAVELNEKAVKPTKKVTKESQDLDIPSYLSQALQSNTDALNSFQNFSHSNKKEYVNWITEAKNEATRRKRLETAIEWMAEGKIRHWKYIKK